MSADENKALIRRLMEAADKGDLAATLTCFADDYVDHNPPTIPGLAPGIRGVQQAFEIGVVAFPDAYHTVSHLIAEDDLVVARVTGQGTFKGEFAGIPPNGQPVSMEGIVIYRIAIGKIVEKWAQQNRLGLLQQMGVIPTPG